MFNPIQYSMVPAETLDIVVRVSLTVALVPFLDLRVVEALGENCQLIPDRSNVVEIFDGAKNNPHVEKHSLLLLASERPKRFP